MTSVPGDRRRTLATLIALGICNHAALSGARVVVSLDALAGGASAALVGTLMALFALLPMLSAVHAGRLTDRIGVKAPMRVGTLGVVIGVLVPALLPGLASLFVSAALVGSAFMLFQVATQRVTGDVGGPAMRAENYALLALGYSVSGFVGPLVAGFAIEQLGFRIAFALLAIAPLAGLAVMASGRPALPRHEREGGDAARGTPFELLANPALRRLFAINALFALGWDLHTIFVPIYGARIGISAGAIGLILSAFAAATFVVRFAMRWIGRRWREHEVMTGALLVAAAVYVAFPFVQSPGALMALSFVLGLGLGSGQPMVMSLLHARAPVGRMGEAAGLRMSLIQSSSVVVPVVFGVLGSSLGLLPVFWFVGALLAGGGWYTRRDR